MTQAQTDQIKQLVDQAKQIVVIQADNPDGDSLGSSLALEQILGEMGKEVYMYCGVDMPSYLQYLPGYDRVAKGLPHAFDLTIIVDTSAHSLLQKLGESGQEGWVKTRPCVVLDHHEETENDISFATAVMNMPGVSSTGEVIYNLAKQLNWPLDARAGEYIMTAILGDTQGLTNHATTPDTYRVMAELAEMGVNRPKLEELRREYSKMAQAIFRYKAHLIDRTEFSENGHIACVTIPQEEINMYSPLYNPAPLIQTDMLMTQDVGVALVFKRYNDGKILCSIRCNNGFGIGADLAKAFGGGGHPYAAGFKIQDGRPFNEVKSECMRTATELIDKLQQESSHETLQHTY